MRKCALCHNWRPESDFLIPYEEPDRFYNHPNCSACRRMLESFGIEQKPSW